VISANIWLISLLSWGTLSGLGYAGLLVSRENRRQEKLAQRITGLVTPHLRAHRIELSAFIQTPTVDRRSAFGRVAAVFGFDPANLDRCPLKWWVVLQGALVVAKLVQALASGMIGPWSLLALPVVWVVFSRMVFGYFNKQFQDKLLRQFPDALAMIVRAVRVGIPVPRALNNVARDAPAPTSGMFAQLVNQVSVGVALDAAVLEMGQRSQLPEYRFFATAITLQMQTGGTLSETLENLADVMRKRVALKARALALASEARTMAAVLAGLPMFSGVALWILNPGYIGKLFEPGPGRMIFSGAVLSLSCGLLMMRTMIRRSVT
jgi:tight adherence protein B